MPEQIIEISSRLQAQFARGNRLVFWEDPSGDYADKISDISLVDACLIDVTGCELASKRHILRVEPEARFVIYRTGEAPDPMDDFLYDLKLAAEQFSCSVEGLWAQECGVPVELEGVLSDHSKFFGSALRKRAFAALDLPKDTKEGIEFAMAVACLGVREDSSRDAARGMARRALSDWAVDEGSVFKKLQAYGLEQAFWGAMGRYLGYASEAPGVPDLAFRIVASECAGLVEGVEPLSADAKKVFSQMMADPNGKDAVEAVVREVESEIEPLIPAELRTVEALRELAFLPKYDEWILMAMLAGIESGAMDSDAAAGIWSQRRYMFWADKKGNNYLALLAAAQFKEAVSAYAEEAPSAMTVDDLFRAYCDRWHVVDMRYREFFAAYRALGHGLFRQRLGGLADAVMAQYDDFLIDLNQRWQSRLLDGSKYPPKGIEAQKDFYNTHLLLRNVPKPAKGKRIGVIVSDSLRYESGVCLASCLNASMVSGLRGKAKADCTGMLSMLPSYTQLGMASLLPGDEMEIDLTSECVIKDGLPTSGSANRLKVLQSREERSAVFKAEDILAGQMPDMEGVALAYVYHNVIDKTGDSRETERKVFAAVEDAFKEIERIVADLVKAGCGTVLVTADHGFLYQDQDPEGYLYVKGNSQLTSLKSLQEASYSRRFALGEILPTDDELITYAAVDLSLKGDYQVAFPKGIMRLRVRGSGARFVHGGASLQELVVPVVTLKTVASKEASRPTGVDGHPIGRTSITGPSVAVNVQQTEPCGDSVTPITVKVGVYAPGPSEKLLSTEERVLELAGTSSVPEDLVTRVSLSLAEDVDDYQTAIVRIGVKAGQTNKYNCVWEKEYSVNRMFGMDF